MILQLVTSQLLDSAIIELWRSGLNTYEIAKKLGRDECVIANRLAQLRDERAGE